MIDIKVKKVGIYNEISKDHIGFYGLLDEKESIQMACKFISVAEDLLPPTHVKAEIDLSVIREALEIS